MFPDQQQPPSQPSYQPGDYLNQIAPQQPKRAPFRFGIKQAIIIGIALIILVIILAIVVGALTGGKKVPLERLSVRLNNTQTVVTSAQTNLKSSTLRSLNSNLNIYLTNTKRDITPQLVAADINSSKIDRSIATSESVGALTARLEDARLNAVFDRTYAREMAYRLSNLLVLMNQIYMTADSTKLKSFIKSAYDNLKPTQEAFANFSTAE